MEAGVEAGDLRQVGPGGSDGVDRGKAVRLVQWCKRDERRKLGKQRVVDPRRIVTRATVDDTVADGADRAALIVLANPGDQAADAVGLDPVRPRLIGIAMRSRA